MAERPVYNVKRSIMEYDGLGSVSSMERYKIITPKSTLDMTYKELTNY